MRRYYKNLLVQLPLIFCLCNCHLTVATPLSIVCHEFAPFSYIDQQGQTTGILVEMARLACEQWPEGCEIDLFPNRRAKQLFHAGEVNGHFLGWNSQRAKMMWFSIPLIETEYGFYSLPATPLNSLHGAAGKEIGVFMPSNTYYSLKELDIELQSQDLAPMKIRPFTAGNKQPLKMLVKKRFDAYYVNKAVGAYYAGEMGYEDLHYFSSQKTVQYFLAFTKKYNNKQEIIKFNQLLTKLMLLGTFDELFKQWQVSPSTLQPSQYEELSIPYIPVTLKNKTG